jgi:hypothetical protein
MKHLLLCPTPHELQTSCLYAVGWTRADPCPEAPGVFGGCGAPLFESFHGEYSGGEAILCARRFGLVLVLPRPLPRRP